LLSPQVLKLFDSIMACKLDPRRAHFYQKKQLVGAQTAKLRGKGLNKSGLSKNQNITIAKKLAKAPLPVIPPPAIPPPVIPAKRKSESSSPDVDKENAAVQKPKRAYKKQRRSADRDLALLSVSHEQVDQDRRSRSLRPARHSSASS
jgi:hypothetical protein